MDARIEVEADPAAIDALTDEFDPVEQEDAENIVLEEDMADVIELVQLQDIPTDAWVIQPEIEA
jgi:hypothetical protein